MRINRYKFFRDTSSECSCDVDPDEDGDYVSYSDHLDIVNSLMCCGNCKYVGYDIEGAEECIKFKKNYERFMRCSKNHTDWEFNNE